ncbi:MAG: hypothetical protein ACHQC8_06000 [Solirubrobacterales bacterium]
MLLAAGVVFLLATTLGAPVTGMLDAGKHHGWEAGPAKTGAGAPEQKLQTG